MSGVAPEVVTEVETKARRLYEDALGPVAARYEFEAAPPASETSGLPMVLLLGNHSSGKSSFINYLVGDEVQRTGVAPVDDGFTIITHGEESQDKDGNAVVTNPALHWGDLERFGPTLLSHLVLRLRPSDRLKGLALVDSPGMIDTADASVKRTYDFPAVVRWFAERADVILLLFDPDTPARP
jgi:predicted GTPase